PVYHPLPEHPDLATYDIVMDRGGTRTPLCQESHDQGLATEVQNVHPSHSSRRVPIQRLRPVHRTGAGLSPDRCRQRGHGPTPAADRVRVRDSAAEEAGEIGSTAD